MHGGFPDALCSQLCWRVDSFAASAGWIPCCHLHPVVGLVCRAVEIPRDFPTSNIPRCGPHWSTLLCSKKRFYLHDRASPFCVTLLGCVHCPRQCSASCIFVYWWFKLFLLTPLYHPHMEVVLLLCLSVHRRRGGRLKRFSVPSKFTSTFFFKPVVPPFNLGDGLGGWVWLPFMWLLRENQGDHFLVSQVGKWWLSATY